MDAKAFDGKQLVAATGAGFASLECSIVIIPCMYAITTRFY
jgi:hypothetical protein